MTKSEGKCGVEIVECLKSKLIISQKIQ